MKCEGLKHVFIGNSRVCELRSNDAEDDALRSSNSDRASRRTNSVDAVESILQHFINQ